MHIFKALAWHQKAPASSSPQAYKKGIKTETFALARGASQFRVSPVTLRAATLTALVRSSILRFRETTIPAHTSTHIKNPASAIPLPNAVSFMQNIQTLSILQYLWYA